MACGVAEDLRGTDLWPASERLGDLDAARTPLEIVTCLEDATGSIASALSTARYAVFCHVKCCMCVYRICLSRSCMLLCAGNADV